MRSRSYLAPFLVAGILLLGRYASAAPVTNPNDPRTWQGATVQTFADVLTLVEGHPVTAQDVINRQLLDDGVFPLTANVVFPTTPISDGPCPQSTVKLPTGIMLSQSSPACYGYSMNPTDYSYVIPYYFIPPYNFPPPGLWPCSSTPQSDPAFDLPNLILSGSCLDMWWAQEQGNGSALYVAQGPVWDLGGQANQLAVFAIADHEPLPQEAIEHTVYLSNNRNATEVGSDGNTQWVLATLKKVYLEGWRSDWITDGFTAVWQLPNGQAFRYAKVTAGGPTALQSDGDDEIDAVMGLNALGQSVQQPQVFKCPLSQGYWKNHASAWPVQSISLGGKSYTKAEALTLLNTPVKGDASLILAYQLIAAKVNIANGSDPTPAQSAVAAGDSLLSQFSGKLPYNVKSSSTTGVAMTNTGSVLDGYNTGQLTSSCKP